MDLNSIRNYLEYIHLQHPDVSKDITPTEFTNLLNICQLLHFKKKVGLPEDYQPLSPHPRQAFEITRKITMDLERFVVTLAHETGPLIINRQGFATLPTDCYYPISLLYRYIHNGTVSNQGIDILPVELFMDREQCSITFPTKRDPIANISGGRIKFLPKDLRYAEFSYLRRPVDCYFAVTNTDGYVAYDVTNSVQLEFDDINLIDIMQLMTERIGINLNRQDIVALGDKFKQQGQ